MAGKNLNEEESAARLAEAKRALAGPEWTAKHESEERQRQMVAEQTALNQQLTALAKAKEKLGWQPRVRFSDLCKIMVDSDMRQAIKQLNLQAPGGGDKIIQERFSNKWWVND